MNQLGTRTLTTPRLVLRRHTLDDTLPMFTGWMNDPRVTFFLSWQTHPDPDVTRAMLQSWVDQYESDGYYNWAIDRDGTLVGNILAFGCDTENERLEIGYSLRHDCWGQGIMPEALAAVLGFFFEQVQLHRVCLRHDTRNPASGQVMRKCGLRHEGTLRGELKRKDGDWADIAVWGILREEWLANKKWEVRSYERKD